MIEIDQMALADVGGNPIKLAQAITSQLDLSVAVPVRKVAAALGIIGIREEVLDGLEGRANYTAGQGWRRHPRQ